MTRVALCLPACAWLLAGGCAAPGRDVGTIGSTSTNHDTAEGRAPDVILWDGAIFPQCETVGKLTLISQSLKLLPWQPFVIATTEVAHNFPYKENSNLHCLLSELVTVTLQWIVATI